MAINKHSGIEWTNATLNPILKGCTTECPYCYARAWAQRHKGTPAFPEGWVTKFYPERLKELEKYKTPSLIFMDSMGDMFGEEVKTDWIYQCFEAMSYSDQHIYQVLTKNPGRTEKSLYGAECGFYLGGGDYYENIWIGTSVDTEKSVKRIDQLKEFKRHSGGGWHLFASFEPLLERMPNDIETHLNGLEWAIIGQRTKPYNNPPAVWVHEIVECCEKLNIPYFVKNNLIERGYYPAELKERYQKYPAQMKQLLNRRKQK